MNHYCWKITSSRFYFTVIFIFNFNVIITGKENVCNIIRFQWVPFEVYTTAPSIKPYLPPGYIYNTCSRIRGGVYKSRSFCDKIFGLFWKRWLSQNFHQTHWGKLEWEGGGGLLLLPSDHFWILKRELKLSIFNHLSSLRSFYHHFFHKNLICSWGISYNPSPGVTLTQSYVIWSLDYFEQSGRLKMSIRCIRGQKIVGGVYIPSDYFWLLRKEQEFPIFSQMSLIWSLCHHSSHKNFIYPRA